MKYKVTALYYSYREITVEANDEEEAAILAQSAACGLTDEDYMKIGKNAILEGVEDITEVEQ